MFGLVGLHRLVIMGRRTIFGGIIERRERWGLTWRGWLFAGSAIIAAGLLLFFGIHPLLAVTHPVNSNVLVVEGWVGKFAIDAAVKEFNAGHYDRVFTTGGPVEGMGGYSNDFNTSASVGAELLVGAGLPASLVKMVPSHVSGRNRTFSSALALREYFLTNGVPVKNFNVLTEGAHARRTRLLFQEAFGKGVQVGIISVQNPDYDANHWWKYSDGVREVIGETIAYFYAKFFFWPAKAKS